MTEKTKPVDKRWSSYPETVLHFPGDPPAMVDLRVPVESSIRNAFHALGLPGEFAVLTAFNPRGVDKSKEENDRRMKELEAELQSVGHSFVRLDACSPDKSHCECSVAIWTSLDQAIEIAKRWKQIAIFWWDLSSFWIYGAMSEANPIKLPVE